MGPNFRAFIGRGDLARKFRNDEHASKCRHLNPLCTASYLRAVLMDFLNRVVYKDLTIIVVRFLTCKQIA